jgi:hypothetical protein
LEHGAYVTDYPPNATYTIYVKTANSCTATTAPVTITVYPLPVPEFINPPATYCAGSAFTIKATGGESYCFRQIWVGASHNPYLTGNDNAAGSHCDSIYIDVGFTGTMYIDWGDETNTLLTGNGWKKHFFAGGSPLYTVTGQARTITTLQCQNNPLIELDVTECTALTFLNCSSNSLSTLDVTKNTALTNLWVRSNLFTTDGLNALFNTLHNNSGTKTFYIYNNPKGDNSGTQNCNKDIAIDKGWTVNTN